MSSGKGFTLKGPARAPKLNSVDKINNVGHPRDRQELTDDWCEWAEAKHWTCSLSANRIVRNQQRRGGHNLSNNVSKQKCSVAKKWVFWLRRHSVVETSRREYKPQPHVMNWRRKTHVGITYFGQFSCPCPSPCHNPYILLSQ